MELDELPAGWQQSLRGYSMANFIGEVCPICKQKFKAGDDIVVCPECGAPHHRSCYLEHGKCAYEDRHAQGFTVSRQKEEQRERQQAQERSQQQQSNSPGGKVCGNCGTVNPDTGLFCIVCGSTLSSAGPQAGPAPQGPAGAQTSFGGVKPEEKIGEIPAKDFAAYVGSNAVYYLPKFASFGNRNKTVSLNFTALFFPSLYYLYRKMYPAGIFLFLINLIFNVFSMVLYMNGNVDISSSGPLTSVYYAMMALSVLTFVFSILSGLFANRLYYNKAVRDIKRCQKEHPDPQEYVPALMKKGTVSLYAIAIAMVILSVVTMVMVYASVLYQ